MAEEKSKYAVFGTLVSHFIGPFYRSGTTGSFGRLWASILIFSMCCRYWLFPSKPFDPPTSMVEITLAFMAYVFGSKGLDIYKDVKTGTLSVKSSGTDATTIKETSEAPATNSSDSDTDSAKSTDGDSDK